MLKNVMRKMSRSISSHFGAIHSKMCVAAKNCKKIH